MSPNSYERLFGPPKKAHEMAKGPSERAPGVDERRPGAQRQEDSETTRHVEEPGMGED